MKDIMTMTRIELIEEMRSHTPPRFFQEATRSTTAMLRAWVAYCRSVNEEKGSTEGLFNVPSDYTGLFFGIQKQAKITRKNVQELFEGIMPFIAQRQREADEQNRHGEPSFVIVAEEGIEVKMEGEVRGARVIRVSRRRGIFEEI